MFPGSRSRAARPSCTPSARRSRPRSRSTRCSSQLHVVVLRREDHAAERRKPPVRQLLRARVVRRRAFVRFTIEPMDR